MCVCACTWLLACVCVCPLQPVHRATRSLSSALLVQHSCSNVQAFFICNVVLMKGQGKVRVVGQQ